MPGESKRSGSPNGARSVSPPTRRGPRTRSMAHKEATDEQHSVTTADCAPTGSEVHNNDGGSPSSNESPSPVPVQRKKARRVPVTEITEEHSSTLSPQPPSPESEKVLTPGRHSSGSENQEHVVEYYTHYMFSRLWRAIENCEVWDTRLVKAFMSGPCALYSVVSNLHRRMSASNQATHQNPDEVTESLLTALRPRGLYSCCARIFQKNKKGQSPNARPLKRKKPEPDSPAGPSTSAGDEETSSQKFKHRFLMDPPQVIMLSGPDGMGLDEEMEIVE